MHPALEINLHLGPVRAVQTLLHSAFKGRVSTHEARSRRGTNLLPYSLWSCAVSATRSPARQISETVLEWPHAVAVCMNVLTVMTRTKKRNPTGSRYRHPQDQ